MKHAGAELVGCEQSSDGKEMIQELCANPWGFFWGGTQPCSQGRKLPGPWDAKQGVTTRYGPEEG